MNLSKILVSVNIAATLPIAVQVGAQASNQTPTEASALNNTRTLSLETPIKATRSQVSTAKKNFSLAKSTPQSIEVNGVKLRAFMPGRKLPSSADLQAPLVSQQAQMAPELPSSLNGSVSESYSRGSAYSAPNPSLYTSAAPRVVLNQVQAVARQIKAASSKKNASPIRPTSIQPVTASKPLSTTADFGQFSKDVPASWMANDKNLSVVETPNPSPQEMAQIERLIEQQKPLQAESTGGGTAGPAPFPLNLLPQQSLKQVLGASAVPQRPAQGRVAPPPAGFGSWRAGMGGAQGGMPSRISSALPPGGFHSNLHGGHFGSYITPHNGHKFAFRPAGSNGNKMIIAQAPRPVAPVKVATYAPYNTVKAF